MEKFGVYKIFFGCKDMNSALSEMPIEIIDIIRDKFGKLLRVDDAQSNLPYELTRLEGKSYTSDDIVDVLDRRRENGLCPHCSNGDAYSCYLEMNDECYIHVCYRTACLTYSSDLDIISDNDDSG